MKKQVLSLLPALLLLTVIGLTEDGFGEHKRVEAGIGPFRLGMTVEQVNDLLPHPFGSLTNMPVAAEFHDSEIRYFWMHTSEFDSPADPGSLFTSLSPFQECWASPNSYVTFLFSEERLTRISVRFFDDCKVRDENAKTFADSYRIPLVRRKGNVWFRRSKDSVTVELRLSRELTAVDVFKKGSPEPSPKWPEEK